MKINFKNKKANSGFTLIEALVYLVLFGILMGGAIVAAYSIFESGNRNSAKILEQEEGNFLLGKVDWALSGISTVDSPTLGFVRSKLEVTSLDPSIGSISIELNGSDVVMQIGGVTQTLNNSNTSVEDLLFEYRASGNVEWIAISFTLNSLTADGKPLSQKFESTKYLRK